MKNKIRQKTLIYRPHYNLGYVPITFYPDTQTDVYDQRLGFLSWMSKGLRTQVLLKYMHCIVCIMIPRKLYRITRYTIKSQSFNENTFPVRIKENISSYKIRSIILSKKTYFCHTLEDSNISQIWPNPPIFQFFPLTSNQIICFKFDSFYIMIFSKTCWQLMNFKSSQTLTFFSYDKWLYFWVREALKL